MKYQKLGDLPFLMVITLRPVRKFEASSTAYFKNIVQGSVKRHPKILTPLLLL